MAQPASLPELVDVIRRSRLVEERCLSRAVGDAVECDTDPFQPHRFLAKFVRDGALTQFQASRLAEGVWQGFVLGEYALLDHLGAGGMGQVFLARNRTCGRRVAIKVLHHRLAADPVARARFFREARAATALTHPNIVHVLGVVPDGNPPYLVMEYIDGINLQAAVALGGTFDAGTMAHCGRQVAFGLQRAADINLVHRDIKPANLLISRAGLVKILDLGIVRMDASEGLTLNTREQSILGTADYLAPEQAINSHEVDARADIYSLGATLYFLLAGHPPFIASSPAETVRMKLRSDPQPIHHLRPDVPVALSCVIQRMLAREPEDRFASPLEVAEVLTPFSSVGSNFPEPLFDYNQRTLADCDGKPSTLDLGNQRPECEDPPTDVIVVTLPDLGLPDVKSSG